MRADRPLFLRLLFALLVATGVGGCAIKTLETPPEGRLEIVGPGDIFTVDGLSPDWKVGGDRATAQARLRVVTLDGVPALRVDGGRDAFTLVRRTYVRLLVSPYLSWSWRMPSPRQGAHPLQIIVGFQGGHPKARSRGAQPLVWTGSGLPPHDRRMALVYGPSGLQRGSYMPVPRGKDGKPLSLPPQFVVRGGPEHQNTWQLDTVDLLRRYREQWPNDDPVATRIVFIGFAYSPRKDVAATPRGYLSGLVLNR